MGTDTYCWFGYLYRDASNYKAYGGVLLRGMLSDSDVQRIRAHLQDEEFFIAEQIGLPTLYEQLEEYSDGPTGDDHVWHSFECLRPATRRDIELNSVWGEAEVLRDRILAVGYWRESFSKNWGQITSI
jgi:hypothetical protein